MKGRPGKERDWETVMNQDARLSRESGKESMYGVRASFQVRRKKERWSKSQITRRKRMGDLELSMALTQVLFRHF